MLDARRVVAVCGPSGGRLPNQRALRTSLNRRDHCCAPVDQVVAPGSWAGTRMAPVTGAAAQPCTTSSWVQSAKPSRPDNFK